MKTDNHHESKLWELLEKERLADLSQYHRPHFFEEVPLYARASDLVFLSNYSKDEANAILLRFSLKFLKALISYEEHRTPFLAAITVWECSKDDAVVPNVFVWSDPILKLHDRLCLQEVKTPFAKKMKQLVTRLRLRDRFEVFEDVSTVAEMARIFIGPAVPAYQGFLPLSVFRKRILAGAGKKRSASGSK